MAKEPEERFRLDIKLVANFRLRGSHFKKLVPIVALVGGYLIHRYGGGIHFPALG